MNIEGTSINLVRGEVARLIPVGSEKNVECRATSILLATMSVVEQFASAMLASVGQKIGARSQLSCYTEVVLPQASGKLDRPDGLIVLRTGKRVWSALVEAKVGNAQLNEEQVQKYLALAKLNKIDAVITISNQFVALPTHHPIKVPKVATRSVGLYHWSWMALRTQAIYQLDVLQDIDPEQRYILNEFVRYFMHPSAGVKSFDAMNAEWKTVCLAVKNGGRLNKNSDDVVKTIGAWYQEQRDISLLLTRKLKAPVSVRLKPAHKNDAELRLKDDCADFVEGQSLSCKFEVPDAANDLQVTADLARRVVCCSMEVAAPTDKKTTKARVNWLTRQLAKTENGALQIVAKWPSRVKDTAKSLEILREDPAALQCENPGLVPSRFEVMLVRDLAGKFSGSKTFLEGLNSAVEDFYHEAGEHLRVWVPPAPKLLKSDEDHPPEGGEELVPVHIGG
ncbi:hypothetical protein [Kordiimonas sp.]|uniref:hypothetical protein n=1 Tax=Kordiimonas sp. TaxID=1970157 RepID=UPI003A956735